MRLRADGRQRFANLDRHLLPPLWYERPHLEDLIADRHRLRGTGDGSEHRSQHAAANLVVSDVDLPFVQRVTALGKRLGFELVTPRVARGHKPDAALADKWYPKVDRDVDDVTGIVDVCARRDLDSLYLHTAAGVRAGGGSTLRRMRVFHV